MKTFKIIIIIFVVLHLYGCGNNNEELSIEAQGNIETVNIVISSKVSGEVLSILKDEGAKVNKGDTVLIIDSETYELRLAEAIAIVQQAQAQLNLLKNGARSEDIKLAEESLKQAEINLNTAERDKERMINLYGTKTITQKQYEDAISRYNISVAQFNSAQENYNKIKNLARPEELQQASANLDRANANLNLIKKSLNDCFVKSPIDGIIVGKFIEKGETANVMSSLYQVSDLSSVELVIYIPETKLGKIKVGQTTDITTDTYPGKVYKGKVIYISPQAEFTPKNIQTKEERTKLVFAIKIKIENPDLELKDGMPADAVIRL